MPRGSGAAASGRALSGASRYYIYVNLFLKAENQLVPVRVATSRGPLCCCMNVSTERQTVPPVPPVPAAVGMAPAFCSATPTREQSWARGWRHQEPTRGRALPSCSAQTLHLRALNLPVFFGMELRRALCARRSLSCSEPSKIFRCEAVPPSLLPSLQVVPKLPPGLLGSAAPWPGPGRALSIPACPSSPGACPACSPPAPSSWRQLGGSRAAGSLQGRAIPIRHDVSCASLEDIHLPCMVTAGRMVQALSMCCSWCLCCHLLQSHQPRVEGFSVCAGCW